MDSPILIVDIIVLVISKNKVKLWLILGIFKQFLWQVSGPIGSHQAADNIFLGFVQKSEYWLQKISKEKNVQCAINWFG